MSLQKHILVSILKIFEISAVLSFIHPSTSYCQDVREKVTIIAAGLNEDSSTSSAPKSSEYILPPKDAHLPKRVAATTAEKSEEIDRAIQKAKSLLNAARLYLKTGHLEAAEKFGLEAILCAPPGSEAHEDANRLLSNVLAQINKVDKDKAEIVTFKQKGMLRMANRLVAEGNLEAASQIVQDVLTNLDESGPKKEIETTLDRIHPGWWSLFLKDLLGLLRWILKWLIIIGISTAMVMVVLPRVLLSAMCIVDYLRSWIAKTSKWRLDGIVDDSKLGVNELTTACLQRLNTQKKEETVTAGLLRLEGTKFSPLIHLVPSSREIDFVPALGSLPTIAGIHLASIGNLLSSLRKWLKLRQPCINGRAVIKDGQLIVRLTAQAADGIIKVVSAYGELKSKEDVAAVLAEEVSFKMLYLISKECSVSQSQAAAELRKGLESLDCYISGSEAEGLERAYELFASVRRQNPTFTEAHLYEGIALDLLEEHDKAIEYFEFVKANSRDSDLKERAAYNLAISHLRNLYQLEEIETAIDLLEEITGKYPDLAKLSSSPVKALGLAAKADAIAHRPLFWETVAERDSTLSGKNEIEKNLSVLNACVQDIENIVQTLRNIDLGNSDIWDDLSRRQLTWATHNALGDVYLNSAMKIQGTSADSEIKKKKEDYVQRALSKFRECEMLLPPGVETLSNLGTVFLVMGDLQEARKYLDKAKELNKNYEYAYYRLAQCWENEGNEEKIKEVLRSFGKSPRIPGFQEMYEKYGPAMPAE